MGRTSGKRCWTSLPDGYQVGSASIHAPRYTLASALISEGSQMGAYDDERQASGDRRQAAPEWWNALARDPGR